MEDKRMEMLEKLPVHTVLIKISLPMMISFFIQAMYNIVDSMFVARISEEALTAVSLAFPMQMIVTAISVGSSTGVSAVWSRNMGEGNKKEASFAIHTMSFMCLAVSVLLVALGIFASGPLMEMQTNIAEITMLGTTYLRINWMFSFGALFGKYYERLLVSSGRSTMAMTSMLSGAIFNLIFDPLLIFGLGPFPEMGIAGAAYATVGGQILSAFVSLILNAKFNSAVKSDLFIFAPKARSAAAILRVGLPSIITMGLSSVTGFFINQILLIYSTTATAVYGIWMKLQNFCYMPLYGLNNGMVPILSYNYGIGHKDRVKKTINISILGITVFMCILTVVFELIPGVLLSLFNAGEYMRELGIVAIRMCVISLPLGAISGIYSTAMQALDHSRYAMIINLLRQCIFLISSFWIISVVFGSPKLIWAAIPLTEVLTFVTALLLNRKFTSNLGL